MPCPAKDYRQSPSACPGHVLSITDAGELAACRACPRGRAMMETLRGALPDALFETLPPLQEVTMENRDYYTVPELAELLGVDYQTVTNARAYRDAQPKPGSKNEAVRTAMRERGITWDQVVPAQRGGARPKKDAPPQPEAAHQPEPARAPAAVNQDFEAAIAEMEAEVEAHAELAHATLAHIPLEALIAEITRRMPRAEVVLR